MRHRRCNGSIAGRIERYVDSVRDKQSLDEIELHKETVALRSILEEMSSDLEILVNSESGISPIHAFFNIAGYVWLFGFASLLIYAAIMGRHCLTCP